MKFDSSKSVLTLLGTSSLINPLNQVNAFSPPSSGLSKTKSSLLGGNANKRSTSIDPLSLFGIGEDKGLVKIERTWTYTDETSGETYTSDGNLKVRVFLPEGETPKGTVFFMHGFSQYTEAYQDSLKKVANSANVAVISTETGITAPIVLFEILKNPLAAIKDRNFPQFVLQRALSQDTVQCIEMVMKGDPVFKDMNIKSNLPIGVSGHSMGGGLSFPVAADFSKVNYVFTMAPAAGVPQFSPIEEGVYKRTPKNSMLLAGTWDQIAKERDIKKIGIAANGNITDSSIFVEIDRGLHTGFEDELVITKIPLDTILGKLIDLPNFIEKGLFAVLGFLRTNTGQLQGSEVLMGYFFDQMVKGKKVTPEGADVYLDERLKDKWDKKFEFSYAKQDPRVTDNMLPSYFFLASAASLAYLGYDIQADTALPETIGTWALFWTTLAVGWDNLIIGLGKPVFADAETDEKQYSVLKYLSYPRFTAHAVLVPFLYATDAEIGKAMGIDWLQNDTVQTGIVVASAVLAIVSRVRFVNSPGIDIKDTSDSPPEALENSLLWFTYKEVSFLYVVPAILLALFNLYIGYAGFGGEYQAASLFMLAAGVSVLWGNSKPSYVARFTGNLTEVVMLWCIFGAVQNVLV